MKQKIGIKLFPNCVVQLIVLGTKILDKDILIGMDMCADIHEKIKHDYPLWKNKDFFVQLHFKLKMDINHTKASNQE